MVYKLDEKFFQIKVVNHDILDKSTMISLMDISKTMLYYQEKSHSDLLSLINATVSHELRNPLNSIKARNMEKSYLYNNIINLI